MDLNIGDIIEYNGEHYCVLREGFHDEIIALRCRKDGNSNMALVFENNDKKYYFDCTRIHTIKGGNKGKNIKFVGKINSDIRNSNFFKQIEKQSGKAESITIKRLLILLLVFISSGYFLSLNGLAVQESIIGMLAFISASTATIVDYKSLPKKILSMAVKKAFDNDVNDSAIASALSKSENPNVANIAKENGKVPEARVEQIGENTGRTYPIAPIEGNLIGRGTRRRCRRHD